MRRKQKSVNILSDKLSNIKENYFKLSEAHAACPDISKYATLCWNILDFFFNASNISIVVQALMHKNQKVFHIWNPRSPKQSLSDLLLYCKISKQTKFDDLGLKCL